MRGKDRKQAEEAEEAGRQLERQEAGDGVKQGGESKRERERGKELAMGRCNRKAICFVCSLPTLQQRCRQHGRVPQPSARGPRPACPCPPHRPFLQPPPPLPPPALPRPSPPLPPAAASRCCGHAAQPAWGAAGRAGGRGRRTPRVLGRCCAAGCAPCPPPWAGHWLLTSKSDMSRILPCCSSWRRCKRLTGCVSPAARKGLASSWPAAAAPGLRVCGWVVRPIEKECCGGGHAEEGKRGRLHKSSPCSEPSLPPCSPVLRYPSPAPNPTSMHAPP